MYYNDGALTHQSEDLASDKTPIGVVGYIAQGDDDYWVEKNTVKDGIGGHALVICLKTIGSTGSTKEAQADYAANGFNSAKVQAYIGAYKGWGSSGTNAQSTSIRQNSFSKVQASKSNVSGSGYKQTIPLWQSSSYPIFIIVYSYNEEQRKANKVPSKSTGWFLPTTGQFYAILLGLGGGNFTESGVSYNSSVPSIFYKRNNSYEHITDPINMALSKVGDLNYTEFLYKIRNAYWTSSEYTSNFAIHITSGVLYGKGIGSVTFDGYNYKENTRSARPFLAF